MVVTNNELDTLKRLFRLSPRETQVLGLMLEGVGANKAIAERLGVAVPTAKIHVHGLLIKIGTSEKLEAAIIALRELGRL